MSQPQSGIIPASNSDALFLAFNWKPDVSAQTARAALADLPALSAALAGEFIDARLVCVVAIGANVWRRIYPAACPIGLQPFPEFPNTVIDLPVTPIDGLLHIRSNRHDVNFELAKRVDARLRGLVEWGEQIHGFRYLDSRDLTGFVDGTENPVGEERAEVALVGSEDPDFAGGSYLHVQRYVHDMWRWQATPVPLQEAIVGRTKGDDIELSGVEKPPTAHIARVVIEEDGQELQILRQSMPYGQLGEMGLFFAAYGRTPQPFTRMLQRMFCPDEQGAYDHLLNYSRPVTGAAFFAPSVDFLQRMALR